MAAVSFERADYVSIRLLRSLHYDYYVLACRLILCNILHEKDANYMPTSNGMRERL